MVTVDTIGGGALGRVVGGAGCVYLIWGTRERETGRRDVEIVSTMKVNMLSVTYNMYDYVNTCIIYNY